MSYAGPFSIPFRRALVLEKWLPDLHERAIPLSEGVTPLDILTNDAAKVPSKLPCSSCPIMPAAFPGLFGLQARSCLA